MCTRSKRGRTDSQDELVVRLVVDFIQDVKHLDGVVAYGAQMVVDRFLDLRKKQTFKFCGFYSNVQTQKKRKRDSTLVPMVGTRPTAAMYVLPMVLIFSMSL